MSVELLNGLVAWYNMKETIWTGAEREVKDASGNGHHGQAINGATTIAGGKVGRAGQLARTSQQSVQIPDEDSLDLSTAGTIAAWVYSDREFPSDDANMAWHGIVSKDLSGLAPGIVYDISWDGTNTSHQIKCRLGDGVNTNSISSDVTFDGAWHLLIFRWDGDYLYLTVDNVHETPVAQTVVPQILGTKLTIGMAFGSDNYTLEGKVDEVGIWSRKLTDEETTYLYSNGNGLTIDMVRTVLPIGADSIRQQIVDALDARLRTITVANGYETDLGNNVFAWRDHALADAELPGLLYQDYDSDPVPEALGSVERHLKIRIEVAVAETQTVSASVLLRKALADVEKAIGSDIYFAGLVEDTTLIRDGSEVEQTSRKHMAARLEFEILYTTERFNPYE